MKFSFMSLFTEYYRLPAGNSLLTILTEVLNSSTVQNIGQRVEVHAEVLKLAFCACSANRLLVQRLATKG